MAGSDSKEVLVNKKDGTSGSGMQGPHAGVLLSTLRNEEMNGSFERRPNSKKRNSHQVIILGASINTTSNCGPW